MAYQTRSRRDARLRLAWTAFAVGFVWFLSKVAQRQHEMRAELREHLGREPTSEELFEYLRAHQPT
jgi:hypothetical protein